MFQDRVNWLLPKVNSKTTSVVDEGSSIYTIRIKIQDKIAFSLHNLASENIYCADQCCHHKLSEFYWLILQQQTYQSNIRNWHRVDR